MTQQQRIRQPIVSGQFYEEDFELLVDQIKDCFTNKFGPGEFPLNERSKHVKAIIVPHAGFMCSGACAAWAYKEMGESEFPDTFIILGTNHQSTTTSTCDLDWETPLGVVRSDKEIIQELESEGMLISNRDHQFEHSIETQLPFLQFVSKDYLKDLKIVPILVGNNYDDYTELITKILKKLEKKVIFIVSGDFTHFGSNYSYNPFNTNIKNNLTALDKSIINPLLKLDTNAFLKEINKTQATVCGKYPIAALIDILNIFDSNTPGKLMNVQLLQYYNSGDIFGDYSSAVGYAAIKFEYK
ncbi:AmmeMemoRadiSam system protein B [Candidatus Woesearchaeota archaeon]|jgi:MEMO1 family protein|nr:AmmeMemoRadiSam system protein B [Candidatus Woesearchaeota archaeon]MBT6519417.1 AmmeMemoRadiSam system protein B [Candidatus Woesearchaeota archaeon]MBT7368922.1 AmmeMemoRadiSam system protein B [Candidatus Woesearchaeota archaeon]